MNERFRNSKSYMLYFLMYCPLGFVCPLIGQYCSSIGFSGTQVGVVSSMGTLGAVLGGIFWGKIFANANKKRHVIIVMFLMAGAMAVTSVYVRVFIFFAMMYGAVYFFQGPSHGLCDHMVIAKGENFPAIRAMGAIGYAAASYAGGLLAENHGLQIVFFLHAAGYVLASIIIYTISEPPHYSDQKNKANVSELFKNTKFVKLLICSFFILGTTMANNTYFSYLYIESGGDIAGVGFAFLLMAGSEALFMAILPRLEVKLPIEKIMVIGIGVAILRFAFYSTMPGFNILLITSFLQGMMNSILLVESVTYFGKIVEPRLSSISVSTYYALGNNFSAIVCNLLGGVVLDMLGVSSVFLLFMIWNVIGLILYVSMGLNKEDNQLTD